MPRYASNKRAYGISDRSGFRYKLRDMRMEWNGSLVGRDEYEAKHPQLDPLELLRILKHYEYHDQIVQKKSLLF